MSSALHQDQPLAAVRRKPRNLAMELVDALGGQIRERRLAHGAKLPSESVIMGQFGVSRTVVREAISRLQAAGLVQTRHGIGTFVISHEGDAGFRVSPERAATLHDVVAVFELRVGVEGEAAALAAQRRSKRNLVELRGTLDALKAAAEAGVESVNADFQFHVGVARATQNSHFVELLTSMGVVTTMPGSRLSPVGPDAPKYRAMLELANDEHQRIVEAIAARDAEAARQAMRRHLLSSCERCRAAVESGA